MLDSLIYFKIFYLIEKDDKKPTANDLFVYTVTKCENKLKVVKLTIAELWKDGYILRINNMNDKTKHINSEKEIKSQVRYEIIKVEIRHD